MYIDRPHFDNWKNGKDFGEEIYIVTGGQRGDLKLMNVYRKM